MLSEADMYIISNTRVNQPGDVIRHEFLGSGEWMVVEAAVSGAGKSYCHTYPDAWRLNLRRLRPDGSIDWSVPRILRFQDTTDFPENMVLQYVEPVRRDRLALGLMTRSELVGYLRWMADEIEGDASARASFNYEQTDENGFSVSAVIHRFDGNGSTTTSYVGQRYVPEKMPATRVKPAA